MSTIQSIGETSLPVALTGDAAPAQRKFESLTLRTVKRQEGETKNHHIAVLVASAVFLPLILIADAVRYAGFKAGEKNGKVAKYFDGKSWSLIDQVTAGSKKLAAKTTQVWGELKGKTVAKYKELTTKKPVTLADLNAKSEKEIKNGVAELVKGYDLHNNSSSVTTKAENKIRTAQRSLWSTVLKRVRENAQNSTDFASELEAALKIVNTAIEEETKDKFYVVLTNYRGDGLPPLSPQATGEFSQFVEQPAQKKQLAELALKKCEADADPVAGLAALLGKGIISAEQAAKALSQRASSLYNEKLQSGLSGAEASLKALLSKATSDKVIDGEKAKEINRSIQPGVDSLAVAAAKDLLSETTDEDALLRSKLSRMGNELVANERLSHDQLSAFTTKAYDQLSGYKTAQLKAQKEAVQQAEWEAARAAELAALPGKLRNGLELISAKQEVLDGKFKAYSGLNKEVVELRKQHFGLKREKVEMVIDGKVEKVKLRDASGVYHDALDDFTRDSVSAEKSSDLLLKLMNNNEETKRKIEELDQLSVQLDQKAAERLSAYRELNDLFQQVERDIAVFNSFYSSVKGDLESTSEIDSLKLAAEKKDEADLKRLQEVQHISLADRIKKRLKVRVTGNPKENFESLIQGGNLVQPGSPASETSTPSAPDLEGEQESA